MDPKRKKMMDERVLRDLERLFPSPDPDAHRYVIEKDKFCFYLYDSRPEGGGRRTKVPVAKFSYMEADHLWQVSWMPPQGRWQKYGRYFDLETAAMVVKGDPVGCFTGEVSPLAYLKRGGK